jgi:acetyltransferase-like isoleucine patch superfamily enzyme
MLTKYFNEVLYKLYSLNNKRLRHIIRGVVSTNEGGAIRSNTLRKIFRSYHDIDIGMYSYGGCFSLGSIPAGTVIGRYCSFARNIYVLNGNHPLLNKSMHPFFYNPIFGYVDDLLIHRTKLTIENDVWVGLNALILPSVRKIENGAVIGAGAVVTTDVPPFAVVAGNPAKIIKYRFPQYIIDNLLQNAWWTKDIIDIKNNKQEFDSFLKPIV